MTGMKSMTIALTSILLTLGACVTTRNSLSTSAERLEENADTLARTVHEESSDGRVVGGYAHDSRILADDAHVFRRASEERDTTNTDLKLAFERLSRSYHVVRDEVDRSDNPAVHEDLRPVTEAYLDIERDMGGASFSSRSDTLIR